MDTTIRTGITRFYGDPMFKTGISRSGYFSIKEAQALQLYGVTLQGLSDGTIIPVNDEEELFIAQVHAPETASLYLATLWNKYLGVIKRSKIGYGFSVSSRSRNTFEIDNDYSSDDLDYIT